VRLAHHHHAEDPKKNKKKKKKKKKIKKPGQPLAEQPPARARAQIGGAARAPGPIWSQRFPRRHANP
jgi:hypothetical protein